jgi:hypothetical protein
MFLIDDILLAPIKGIVWIGEKVRDIAESEVSDEGKIREELLALQLRFELDEINEEEYSKEEKDLLVKLDTARKEEER